MIREGMADRTLNFLASYRDRRARLMRALGIDT